MIVQLRGTSGSGKSTVVREVMRHLQDIPRDRMWEKGRRQPLGYRLISQPRDLRLAIIGHYETACGGCDTISGYDRTFQLIREMADSGHDVLFEGLLLSGDVKRALDLHRTHPDFQVIALDVPLQECIDSVNRRRWAKSPDKPPVNPRNTESKHRAVQTAMQRLSEAGVRTRWVTREEATRVVLTELGL